MIIVSSRLNEWGGPKRKQILKCCHPFSFKSILLNTDRVPFRKTVPIYNKISNAFMWKEMRKINLCIANYIF
jgi:hypothetical protein